MKVLQVVVSIVGVGRDEIMVLYVEDAAFVGVGTALRNLWETEQRDQSKNKIAWWLAHKERYGLPTSLPSSCYVSERGDGPR